MRIETKTITPDVAAKMLERNFDGNRKIRPTYVNALANAMLDGEFVGMNGQTIVIGADDGRLYDGQHRLTAIVQSGTTQKMMVAYVDDGEKAYRTIDAGTPRKASDFIDAPNRNHVAAVAKFMLCIEQGTAPLATTMLGRLESMTVPTRISVLDYFDANRARVIQTERTAERMLRAIGCGSQTVYAAFIDLVKFCGQDDRLGNFIDDVSDVVCTNKTIIALKHAIVRKKMSVGKSMIPSQWQLGTLLNAYELYRADSGGFTLNKSSIWLQKYDALLADAREQRR